MTKVDLETRTEGGYVIPKGIRVYEIAGPLFFGAAKTAMETLETVGSDARVVILQMRSVPVIDATGVIALESILDRMHRAHRKVILCGMVPQVATLLGRAGIKRIPGRLAFAPDLDTALSMALVHDARSGLATPAAGTVTQSPA